MEITSLRPSTITAKTARCQYKPIDFNTIKFGSESKPPEQPENTDKKQGGLWSKVKYILSCRWLLDGFNWFMGLFSSESGKKPGPTATQEAVSPQPTNGHEHAEDDFHFTGKDDSEVCFSKNDVRSIFKDKEINRQLKGAVVTKETFSNNLIKKAIKALGELIETTQQALEANPKARNVPNTGGKLSIAKFTEYLKNLVADDESFQPKSARELLNFLVQRVQAAQKPPIQPKEA